MTERHEAQEKYNIVKVKLNEHSQEALHNNPVSMNMATVCFQLIAQGNIKSAIEMVMGERASEVFSQAAEEDDSFFAED